MSDELKNENQSLKDQLAQHKTGVDGLLAQLDALRGELTDARTISLQLRTNLILVQKSNKELDEKVKALELELANFKIAKTAEVPAP